MNKDAIDLFCGCGGLTLGLALAGFDVVAGADAWKPAIETYRANNPAHEALEMDLSDEDATYGLILRYRPFLVAGGPPCQDFSIAGAKTEGQRADMTVKYARAIARAKPPAFIMENVPRASLSDAYRTARKVFKDAGYGVTTRVVDAIEAGVPQYRKRLFMVGMLGEKDGFLETEFMTDVPCLPVTVKEHLDDAIKAEFYYRHPRTYGRRAIYSVHEPSPTIRGVNRPRPASYRKHPADKADPEEAEALDYRQRALIQTFPPSYIWPDGFKKSEYDLMVGNAVPVLLAAHVAGKLFRFAAEVRNMFEADVVYLHDPATRTGPAVEEQQEFLLAAE